MDHLAGHIGNKQTKVPLTRMIDPRDYYRKFLHPTPELEPELVPEAANHFAKIIRIVKHLYNKRNYRFTFVVYNLLRMFICAPYYGLRKCDMYRLMHMWGHAITAQTMIQVCNRLTDAGWLLEERRTGYLTGPHTNIHTVIHDKERNRSWGMRLPKPIEESIHEWMTANDVHEYTVFVNIDANVNRSYPALLYNDYRIDEMYKDVIEQEAQNNRRRTKRSKSNRKTPRTDPTHP